MYYGALFTCFEFCLCVTASAAKLSNLIMCTICELYIVDSTCLSGISCTVIHFQDQLFALMHLNSFNTAITLLYSHLEKLVGTFIFPVTASTVKT